MTEEDFKSRMRDLDAAFAVKWPDRPLLVAAAPTRGAEGWPPLTGVAGDRIATLAGLRLVEGTAATRPAFLLMMATERVNLLDRWPGRSPSNDEDAFPVAEGTESARRLVVRLLSERRLLGRVIVLLGRRVAACFGVAPDAPQPGWDTACVEVPVADLPAERQPTARRLLAGGVGVARIPLRVGLCPYPDDHRWHLDWRYRTTAPTFLREAVASPERSDQFAREVLPGLLPPRRSDPALN